MIDVQTLGRNYRIATPPTFYPSSSLKIQNIGENHINDRYNLNLKVYLSGR